jgi:hypothetical protein
MCGYDNIATQFEESIMNQFSCIKGRHDLNGLSIDDINLVIATAKIAYDKGLQFCVVLQDVDYGYEVETSIYYMGSATDEWVENYLNSGGMWYYDTPARFLEEIVDIVE